MDKIYTVTTCTKLEKDDKGWPSFGSMRVVGWFDNFIDADKAVRANSADIYEGIYNYSFIECVESGLYPNIPSRQFYKWNDGLHGYLPITEPLFIKHFSNLSIG